MTWEQEIKQIREDPHYCPKCDRIQDFLFQVAKTTSKGQYTGFICPICQHFKGIKFSPFKSDAGYNQWNRQAPRSQRV